MIHISVKLDNSTYRQLLDIAYQQNKTLSDVIRDFLPKPIRNYAVIK